MSHAKALLFSLALILTNAKADIDISQTPLFLSESVPPLNMLVMGKDHKLYYEAYNDASDLNGDGILDVGYKGYLSKSQGGIDYYGYFNSNSCYTYDGDKFTVAAATTTKRCSAQWSGDYLNYLATSRMDALRKVLYGGYRSTDSATETVLQGAFIPRDAHTWGKEYESQTKDGYLISDYTPLSQPVSGYRHLFAVVSLTSGGTPQLRTLSNTTFRIWNWVSKQSPVGGDDCDGGTCTSRGPQSSWAVMPGSAISNANITIWKDTNAVNTGNKTEMDNIFNSTTYTSNSTLCGTGTYTPSSTFDSGARYINPFTNPAASSSCATSNKDDYYHSKLTGTLTAPSTGTYYISVDGDDAVDFTISSATAGRYGANGASNSGGAGNIISVALTQGSTYSFTLRHRELTGDANFRVYWSPPNPNRQISTLEDKNVKVSVCPDNVNYRETNCVAYGSHYKPTGILHDYGASNKMYFGLVSGSYQKNMSGGVLRSKLQSFSKEYNSATGQFCFKSGSNCDTSSTITNGIVSTIDKFSIIDYSYSSWGYGCGLLANRAMTQTNPSTPCYMWGNPIGEMMYETMRYFAGATSPTSAYNYNSTTGKDKTTLDLPKLDTWQPPYTAASSGGAGYASCSVPAMTVISDINPSYDYKLPGSHWDTSVTDDLNLSLNVSTEADKVWTKEGGGTKNIFIGESNDVSDGAPTAKDVTNLSTVRGLAPQEPTKQGTYYSAAISNFGANTKIGGDKNLLTYSIALASPLPTIKFPVGSATVTVVPFAKSVGSTNSDNRSIDTNGAFQPTDQIVDFYVESIANTDPSCPTSGKDCNALINNGLPYASFRINYEDVEQGSDHDMDAFVLYTLRVVRNANQYQLSIAMDSQVASGDIIQHMGYVISGTTADGTYVEVRDNDTSQAQDKAYKLNTPSGRDPGWCIQNLSNAACAYLPISASRTFTPASKANATFLENPLWYAAKYGTTAADPDTDKDGVPDNYFLVTNALTLKDQLNKAFSDISQRNYSVSKPSVDSSQQNTASAGTYVYRTTFDIDGWTGDVIKEKNSTVTTTANGSTTTSIATTTEWKAASKLPNTRNIYMANSANDNGFQSFTWENLHEKSFNGQDLQALLNQNKSGTTDNYGEARTAFIRGDSCASLTGCSTLRNRKQGATKLGDVINSSPILVQGAQYLAYRAGTIDGTAAKYATFQSDLKTRTPMLYLGANDGMLHAFNATSGIEQFAFIPTAVIPKLNILTDVNYGKESTPHQYYVDGTSVVTDVYYDDQWHTVLVGSLGAGGREVFALDITTPSSPKLLWEYTSANDGALGYTLPKPTVSRLHTGEWAVLISNGYNSSSNGAALLILNIKTGNLIKKLTVTPTAEQGETLGSNGLSAIRTADFNSDGIIDYAYAGDVLGNIWRFDLLDTAAEKPFAATAAANKLKVSFSGNPLYVARNAAGVRQPVTAAPSLVRHPTGLGYLVTFGTGRYLGITDKASNQTQTMYGVWDRQTAGQVADSSSTTSKTRTNLLAQTLSSSTTTVEGTTKAVRLLTANTATWYSSSGTADANVDRWGWYFDLTAGERMVYSMNLYGDGLIFSTITPNSDVCSAGLTGITYGINPYTGGKTLYNVFDINGDGKVNTGDNLSDSVVSGIETAGGDTTISDGNLYDTTGKPIAIAAGNNSNGRQSWRLQPSNDEL
ncbi:PilC/PilY family type IV pilus protein [Pseudomonas sp.]|uniref:PilC/PilY family type IV pilus protein n=1 Tax=Pseudomonas sp. TaxID=306 RepID=UPI0028AF94CC|nr:PilC/PilY family type IV pilus protein [Pseudomonas sp.]